jgi:adenylosuccinate lyase
MESVRRMREEGATASDLLDRIAGDGAFSPVKDELARILDPRRLVGRAPEQVDEFLAEELDPAVARHPLGPHAESVRV